MDTGPHDNSSYELLADEVPDLNLELVGLAVLLDVDVDGETKYVRRVQRTRWTRWAEKGSTACVGKRTGHRRSASCTCSPW